MGPREHRCVRLRLKSMRDSLLLSDFVWIQTDIWAGNPIKTTVSCRNICSYLKTCQKFVLQMFKQPNISLFTIVQFFIGTIFVLNTYISVTKRCVQILSSALSIVCVIDWFIYADKSVSWCWRFWFNIIHLINTGTLFKNLTFSENVQKILGKKSFPLTSEYTLKVSEQWQLIYWDL